MRNKNLYCILTVVLVFLSGCNSLFGTKETDPTEGIPVEESFQVYSGPRLKTLRGANDLDLETPLRCNVNWRNQEMVLTLPYNGYAFKLERNGINDKLPRFQVENFSFSDMTAEQAMLKLTKEAGIRLSAKDAPYAPLSGSDINGEFSGVIDKLAEAGEFYYSYDSAKKIMTLSRKTNFTLYAPHSRPILLAILDVMRGSGITNITTDWADYSITFDADMDLEQKIRKLLKTFEDSPVLIAYDVSVFRIYPQNDCKEVEWKEMLDEFDFGTITTAKTGVIGRILTTTDDLNIDTLRRFLGAKASVTQISEGKFIVPHEWFARFDIGKCSNIDNKEAGLSILAKASVQKNNRIFSEITLDSTGGQVSQFNIRSKLGENFLIIGIPNDIFGGYGPQSETVIFMVPRIIRTLKTSETIKNKIL